MKITIETTPKLQRLWAEADEREANKTAIITQTHDTFVKICKQHKLPFEHHNVYREWLIGTQKNPLGGRLTTCDLPVERGQRLPPHLSLPKPYGKMWADLKQNRLEIGQTCDQVNERLTHDAVQSVVQALYMQKQHYRDTRALNICHNGNSDHTAQALN